LWGIPCPFGSCLFSFSISQLPVFVIFKLLLLVPPSLFSPPPPFVFLISSFFFLQPQEWAGCTPSTMLGLMPRTPLVEVHHQPFFPGCLLGHLPPLRLPSAHQLRTSHRFLSSLFFTLRGLPNTFCPFSSLVWFSSLFPRTLRP